jgi:energy-coupling factor transporter transmembrane protein EcfT
MFKSGRVIFYSIVVVLVFIFLILVSKDDYAGSEMGIWLAILLALGAVLSIVVSSVIHLKNNPKSAKSLLMGVGAILVVCLVSYFISSGNLGDDYEKYNITTESQSRFIDMGLYLTIFLGFTAVVSIIVSESVALLKNQ